MPLHYDKKFGGWRYREKTEILPIEDHSKDKNLFSFIWPEWSVKKVNELINIGKPSNEAYSEVSALLINDRLEKTKGDNNVSN